MARPAQYDLPNSGKSRSDDPRGLEGYIREAARKNGVDPDVAVRVARSEGLKDFLGDKGKSGGAFQLYTGGGLGNEFQKATGLDPLDPKNEKATIDYAMQQAAKGGWGPWHGAKKVGIGEFDGIGGGAQTAKTDPAAGYGGIGSDAAASERAANAQVQGTNTSTKTPDVATDTAPGASPSDFISKLQDPKTKAAEGLSEAITGLGQAMTGSTVKGATAPASPTPIPVAPTPVPTMVPMVDPQVAASQRQQLAAAMQRLNSGRLY